MGYFKKIGLGSAVAGLALAAGMATSAQAVDLSYSYQFPDRGAVAATMKWWAGQVTERTGGEVNVEVFWRGALGGFRAAFSRVQSGEADISEIAATFTTAHPTA